MTSRIALGSGIAAIALVLTACGGTGGGDGDGVALEVQTGLAVDSAELQALEAITDRFNDEHADIRIELAPSGPNYENDLKVRLAAGDAPDIWMTHGWSRDRYGEFLEPLQDEPWAAQLTPSLQSSMTDAEGRIFAMPTNVDVNGILVNLDVLADAGFGHDEIATWDDFEDAADAVLDAGLAPITAGGKDMAAPIANRVLSGVFDEDELEQMADGTFVDDAFESGLELIASWKDAGYFNPDYSSATRTTMSEALAQNLTAFAFGPSAIIQDALLVNPDANLGFIPVPSLVGDAGYLAGGERTAFGISKDSDHIDEAKEYLRFLAESDNIAELAAASSSLPGLVDVPADLGVLTSSYDLFVTDGQAPVVPHFDRVYLPNGAWSTLGTVTDSVITGQAGVGDATAQMRDAYERLHAEGQ